MDSESIPTSKRTEYRLNLGDFDTKDKLETGFAGQIWIFQGLY